MSLFLRVIKEEEIEEIISFEKKKLFETVVDEMDREIQSWNSRWRKESLQHYVPIGWSFLVRDTSQPGLEGTEGALVGYFLAQPLLFLDGQTQSLWLEHLQFNSLQVRDELCQLAYKLAREKHLQKVYFPDIPSISNAIKPLKAENWNPTVFQIKTTKA